MTAQRALAAAVLLLAAEVRAAPTVRWVYGWGTTTGGATFGNSEHIRAIDTDADGNVYAVGPSGGPEPLVLYDARGPVAMAPNLGGSDIVLAKVARTGQLVWLKAFGGAGDDGAYDLSIDPTGAVLITGRTTTAFAFGGATVARGGFLAKLTADGAPMWAVATDGIPNEQDADARGDVYVATPQGLARYDGAGRKLWLQPLAGGGAASVRGVAVAGDGSGDALIAGQFAATMTLGGGSITSRGGQDAFVGRLRAADGTAVFLRGVGGAETDYGRGVSAVDGGFFLAGSFTGTADVLGQTLVSTGGQDVFVARLDHAGARLWATAIGSAGDDEGAEVSTTPRGDAVLGGSFVQRLDVGGASVTSAGATDFLVAKVDGRGTPLWAAAPLGGPGRDHVYACGAGAEGGATFAGGFEGRAAFGAFTLATRGGIDGVFGAIDDVPAASPTDGGATIDARAPSPDTAAAPLDTAVPSPDAVATGVGAAPVRAAGRGGCHYAGGASATALAVLVALLALARARLRG